MSFSKVSDIIEHLKEENKRLLNELMFANKCLIKLIEFKSFIELIFAKICNNLERNECERYEYLTQDIANTFGDKRICELTEDNVRDILQILENIDINTLESQEPVRCDDNQRQRDSELNPSAEVGEEANRSQETAEEAEDNGEPEGGETVAKESKDTTDEQLEDSLDDSLDEEEEEDEDEELDSAEDYEPDNFSGMDDGVSEESTDEDEGPKKWKDEKLFECDIDGCGEIFDSKPDLLDHKRNSHAITERSLRQKKYCFPQSNRSFGCFTNALFNRQKRSVHSNARPFECDVCGKTYKISVSLKAHMRCHSPQSREKAANEEKKFVCDEPDCTFRSSKKTYLIEHKASVHSSERPFECEVEGCGKTFKIRRRLNIHMKTHYESGDKSKYPKIARTAEKKYVCDEPGCTFRSPKSTYLAEHKATVHSNERPFTCDVVGCGKTFKIRRRLNEHMKTHSADTPFVCEFEGCGKAFKIKQYLTEHMKYHLEPGYQKKKKTKVCDVPGCNFAAQSNVCLERHRAARHSDERPFECEVCHKRFKLIYILQTHMKTHLDNADTYRCDWPGCDYTAIQLGNVETHKKYVHSDERNFPCDWPACEKRFKTRQDLNEHLKRHKDEKRHACSWPGCQYRSVGYSQLKYHMRTHSNYKPHACQWPGCQWRFVSSSGLKKHMKTHNKQKYI